MKTLAGVGLIALASALLGLNLWLCGTMVGPLRDLEPFDVVFYFPPVWLLTSYALVSFAAVFALHLAITATSDGQRRFDIAQTGYLSPLLLFVLPPITILASMSGYHRLLTPWLYLFVDLRWPFVCAVLAVEAAAVDRVTGGRTRAALGRLLSRLDTDPRAKDRLLITLIALLTLFSWASSPRLRFESIVVGDEPKYLRFVENWYRGGGFDISNFRSLPELPDDAPHLLANVGHFVRAAGVTAQSLVMDLRRLTGAGPAAGHYEVVEPTAAGNWSVRGVHGGLYQGHHPGSALFLIPGYILDRYFLNWTNVYQETVPTFLYATNASIFVIYLLWALALYRLLAAHTNHQLLSFVLVAVGMMSIPATGFSYQYYSETAGGFVIALVAGYATVGASERKSVALACGALTGLLPLMHPRWGPASVIVAGTVLWSIRRRPKAVVWWFLGGFVVTLAYFDLYTYYITGSLLPWTMYEIDPTTPGFSASRALRDLPKLWFHWRWGLIAHAPFYLLALPGLVLFFRRRPATATPVISIIIATAILAASHGWGGSGTTPTRLVAATVPLLLVPVSDSVLAFARSRVFMAVSGLLAVVSIANGFVYNRQFDRSDVGFNPPGISGWKSPLLFARPQEGAHVDGVLVFWIVVCVLAILLPLLRTAARRRQTSSSWTIATAAIVIAFAAMGSALSAYTGNVVGWKFQQDRDTVERRLVTAYLHSPGRPVWSANRGAIEITDLVRNDPSPRLTLHPTLSPTGRDLDLLIEVTTDRPAAAWGTATVDFGDGTRLHDIALMTREKARHHYRQPGAYRISVRWVRPGASVVSAAATVQIADPRIPSAVPGQFARYPESIVVHDVLVGPSGVEVRCSIPPAIGRDDTEWWAWVATAQNGPRGGTMYQPRPTGPAAGGIRTFTFDIEPRPSDGETVKLSVGGQSGVHGNKARSRVVTLQWPSERLTRGTPVAAPPLPR